MAAAFALTVTAMPFMLAPVGIPKLKSKYCCVELPEPNALFPSFANTLSGLDQLVVPEVVGKCCPVSAATADPTYSRM